MEPILQVKGLKTKLKLGQKAYSVVDQVDFNLYPGKTLACVGESGCGKSLMALSLMRILPTPPALHPEGEILYKGKNLLSASEKEMRKIRGKAMAMIFQDPMSALNPVYTVGNQLEEVLSIHLQIYGEEARDRIISALKEVGVPDPEKKLSEYPHQLSGGLKQRVMIAMALLCEPDILIADEPTTALDVTVQAQVLDVMRRLQKKNNMALLIITHDMGVVAEIADEVIVMYAAQVIEKGPVESIFDHKVHPYTQGLFASIPRYDSDKIKPIKGTVPSLRNFPSGCRFQPRCPKSQEGCDEQIALREAEQAGHSARCILHCQGSKE